MMFCMVILRVLPACPPSRITRPGGWKPTCSAPFETTEIRCRFLSDFPQPKSSRLGIAHSPQQKKTKKNKRPAYKGRQTACVTKPLGRRGGKSMRCFEFPHFNFFGGKLQQQTSHNSKLIGSKKIGGIPNFFWRCSSFSIEAIFPSLL